MTEEPQKSRLDSLIGIVRAFFRIDPMIAMIAILIIVPLSIPIINAILEGKTEVVITFVVFIAGITLFVYIPLIVVRTWKDKENDFTENRKEAINKELESRLETKKKASERADQVVLAKIEVLQAQTKAIIENIPNFERILLRQEADKIRESLGLEITDEASLLTRLGLVIESFEVIIKKFDNLESVVPGLQQTIEEINKKFLEESDSDESMGKEYSLSKKELVEQITGMADMIGELEQKLAEKESENEALKEAIALAANLKNKDPDFFAKAFTEKMVRDGIISIGEPNDNPEILASDLPEAGTSGIKTPEDLGKIENAPFQVIPIEPEFAKEHLASAMEEYEKTQNTIPAKIKRVISVGKSKILGDNKVIDDMEIHEVSVMPDEKGEIPDAFKEALNVVENMKESSPSTPLPEPFAYDDEKERMAKPVNYWLCSHCGNKNPLKKVRCRQCRKGKKIV